MFLEAQNVYVFNCYIKIHDKKGNKRFDSLFVKTANPVLDKSLDVMKV